MHTFASPFFAIYNYSLLDCYLYCVYIIFSFSYLCFWYVCMYMSEKPKTCCLLSFSAIYDLHLICYMISSLDSLRYLIMLYHEIITWNILWIMGLLVNFGLRHSCNSTPSSPLYGRKIISSSTIMIKEGHAESHSLIKVFLELNRNNMIRTACYMRFFLSLIGYGFRFHKLVVPKSLVPK